MGHSAGGRLMVGEAVRVRGGGIQESSVPSSHFNRDPKTALEKQSLETKRYISLFPKDNGQHLNTQRVYMQIKTKL